MKITLEIPDSVIIQTFYQAHCGYWGGRLLAFNENTMRGEILDSEDDMTFKITPTTIQTGIANLAKFAPYAFGKLIENDLDGPMADVVLQYCANVVCEIDGEIKPKYG